jgi:hypothetical protein
MAAEQSLAAEFSRIVAAAAGGGTRGNGYGESRHYDKIAPARSVGAFLFGLRIRPIF